MKWFVSYTFGCEPRFRFFRTEDSMDQWVKAFLLENQLTEDQGIDAYGKMRLDYNSITPILGEEDKD